VGNRGAAIDPDTFAYTRNMAADPNQPYFYLADTYNNAIDKYASDGTRKWQIAGLGSAPGQFNNPSGVGVAADHNLYVADGHNRRIEIFEPTNGGFLSLFSCAPCTDPRGVAVDPGTGNIYVADSAAALLKFSPTGQYITTIASRGTGVGQLVTASDVVLDSTYLYVTDSKAGMVKLWNLADGSFVTSIGGFKLPSAAAINPVNGHLRVTEEYGDIVSEWCVSAC
jgi:DNA-binding beta-propeller fold protein YncE